MTEKDNVLMVGADLTSNGGIASVVKSYYKAFKEGNYSYDIYLLKTTDYKDRGLLHKIILLIKAFFKSIYFITCKRVGLLHIHTSANLSFYRKSLFVLIGKLFGKEVVMHIHSSEFYKFFLAKNKFADFVFDKCDCVLVLCSDWEHKLKKKYPNLKVKKIENTYQSSSNKKKISKKENSTQFKVLFVGFFVENKGIKDLVKLAKMLKEKGIDDTVIQIAGKGDLEEYIKKEMKNNNLEKSIDILGWISGEKKKNTFKEADVFILPSYNEGMPITILEAMSYGLPVISTDIAGIPDLVKEKNGFLFKPGNIKGYYNAILKLKQNPELRDKMSYENIERVKLNSKEEIFKKVDNLYKEILKK